MYNEFSNRNSAMTAPRPQLKSTELTNRLNAVTLKPDEFTLKSVEREAKKLVSDDPRASFMLRGMIHSMRGQLADTKQCFSNALKYSSDAVVRHNYASALLRVFAFAEAYEIAEDLVKDFPGDKDHLAFLIEVGIYAGKLDRLDDWVESLSKLNADLSTDTENDIRIATELRDRMGDHLVVVAQSFSELMMRKNVSWCIRSFNKPQPDMPIMLSFALQRQPEEIAELNMEVAAEISTADPYVGEHMVFFFRPSL